MFCSQCGSPNDDAARFCGKCGAPMEAGAAAPAPAAPPPAAPAAAPTSQGTMRTLGKRSGRIVTGKDPTAALVLSIFFGWIGVGQFYNGDWKKGLAMAGASLLLGTLTAGLVTLAVWIWAGFDGYKVARGEWKAW